MVTLPFEPAQAERDPDFGQRPPLGMTSPRCNSHVLALDGVRGVAILMVMLYHFTQGASDPAPIGNFVFRILRLGGSGVDLFFVLSGFLITGILFDAKQNARYYRDFYIRRALRIFPLYYAVLAVCFLFLPLVGIVIDTDAQPHHAWLWCYGTNIIQSWRESFLFGRFTHFWSLAVEEHFYLLWPVVIYTCDRTTGMRVCFGCVLMALACRVGLAVTGDHAVSTYVFTLCRMDSLAVGAFIALAGRGSSGHAAWNRPAILALISAGVLLCLLFYNKSALPKMDGMVLVFRFTLSACFFGAVVLLAVNSSPATLWGRCCSNGMVRLFGRYSYGLYVFHPLLAASFENALSPGALASSCGSVLLSRIAYAALAIGGSLVCALLSWHVCEKHFLRLKDVLAPKAVM